MTDRKIRVKIISVEYIEIKSTLTTTQTNTLIQGLVDDAYLVEEIPRKVKDPEEVKAILLAASKKPPDLFKGLEWEV